MIGAKKSHFETTFRCCQCDCTTPEKGTLKITNVLVARHDRAHAIRKVLSLGSPSPFASVVVVLCIVVCCGTRVICRRRSIASVTTTPSRRCIAVRLRRTDRGLTGCTTSVTVVIAPSSSTLGITVSSVGVVVRLISVLDVVVVANIIATTFFRSRRVRGKVHQHRDRVSFSLTSLF